MSFLHALILGIIEGVTEFLPISSTGHLILASDFLGISGEFVKSFEIAIQLGAVLAILILYGFKELSDISVLKKVLVAFIPTGVIGVLFYNVVKQYFLGSTTITLYALLIGGIIIILFERLFTERGDASQSVKSISFKQAFAIGCFQAFSIIPGVSRAAATIIGGLSLGLSRKSIVEFSFLLAVPTMLAATGFDLVRSRALFSGAEYELLALGFVAAFITALITIRWFLVFIKTHSFTAFGLYRIGLALILFLTP